MSKKQKYKKLNSLDQLGSALVGGTSFKGSTDNFELVSDSWTAPLKETFSGLVNELEEHNKRVKNKIKNYDRL